MIFIEKIKLTKENKIKVLDVMIEKITFNAKYHNNNTWLKKDSIFICDIFATLKEQDVNIEEFPNSEGGQMVLTKGTFPELYSAVCLVGKRIRGKKYNFDSTAWRRSSPKLRIGLLNKVKKQISQ